jgi:hypothetical protein
MDKIELTVLVNKANTAKVKEVGTAHGGTVEDRTTVHALAETKEPAVRQAEKVIDHDILSSRLMRRRRRRLLSMPPPKPSASHPISSRGR